MWLERHSGRSPEGWRPTGSSSPPQPLVEARLELGHELLGGAVGADREVRHPDGRGIQEIVRRTSFGSTRCSCYLDESTEGRAGAKTARGHVEVLALALEQEQPAG